jgi:uncharacterized repeat protein (TIGR01451 family)
VAIKKVHAGEFVVGQTATYLISVTNLGAVTVNPIVVTDTLPTGLTFVSGVGNGWNCAGSAGQNVMCTHPGPLAMGDPPLMLTIGVHVGPNVSPSIINTAHVSVQEGELDETNNSSTDVTGLPAPAPLLSPTGAVLLVSALLTLAFFTLRRPTRAKDGRGTP